MEGDGSAGRAARRSPPPASRAGWRRAGLRRALFLLVTATSLYILWPSLLNVFSAWPDLLSIEPAWFPAMLAFEVASFVCIWLLQCIALRTRLGFAVITAQVAGNAFSRIVPAGAAAGGALQYRMLTQTRFDAPRVATGLAAASLISTSTVFALPLLALPAILFGAPVPAGLAQAAVLGAVAFVLFLSVGAVFLTADRPLSLVAREIERLLARLPREHGSRDLPERLIRQRDEIRRSLGADWWKALLASSGNWLLDYGALLAALTAVGARPRPSLVLLAYVAAVVLGMIPITPGGLGFVEAGLTAGLALAKVAPANAILATLAYRLVSYWLPILAGPIAYALFVRRYDRVDPGPPTA
jgi:uncharacterized protein (TIRG00374 family)